MDADGGAGLHRQCICVRDVHVPDNAIPVQSAILKTKGGVITEAITTSELDLSELRLRVEAEEYRALGRARHDAGDVDDAAAYYQMSLDIFPTAETYTFLATALASRARWDEAIALCEEAIALDSDLGNPYNDIGVYLIEKDELDDALPYFDRALIAPIYDCRHFPHYHRGRILERKARFVEAREAYYQAVRLAPDWEPAQAAYFRVLGWLN